MKNLISYYYNLFINDFKKVNNSFIFSIDEKNYEFIPFFDDINKFYKIYLTVLKNNRYCHEIIFNKDKQILTLYNDKYYILLKKHLDIDKKVDLDEIINYNVVVHETINFSWKDFWKEKIDYYEFQMSQLAVKYKNLKDYFDYYIGLSETAIQLLNYINENDIKYSISHKRIKTNEKLDNFFNPINFVVDSRVRDIAEYIKISFFQGEIDDEYIKYIDFMGLNRTEIILLISRLLYPSYYFDIYDQIIQSKIDYAKVEFFTKKNALYETFLKKIYKFALIKYKIPIIEWLEN